MTLQTVHLESLPAPLQEQIRARPGKTLLVSEKAQEERGLQDRFGFIRDRVGGLPESFDGRVTWTGLLSPIGDQGSCGSSWAWAATSCLADRIAIRSFGKITPRLSPKSLLLCSSSSSSEKGIGKTGCGYSTLLSSMLYLYSQGATTEKCSGQVTDEQLPTCHELGGPAEDVCDTGSLNLANAEDTSRPARRYRALAPSIVAGTSPQGGDAITIMTEIYINGPVSAAFTLHKDFYEIGHQGIYEWSGVGIPLGAQAVKIVGWGKEGAKEFWIVANSWGPTWGEGGYFRMVRGIDNCGLESNCYACIPDLFYAPDVVLPKDLQKYVDKVPWDVQKKRLDIDFGAGVTAGGIDPETGYTRRSLYTYTGFEFEPLLTQPVLNQLMNIQNFTAALIKPLVEGFEQTCIPPVPSIEIIVGSLILLFLIYKFALPNR